MYSYKANKPNKVIYTVYKITKQLLTANEKAVITIFSC